MVFSTLGLGGGVVFVIAAATLLWVLG